MSSQAYIDNDMCKVDSKREWQSRKGTRYYKERPKESLQTRDFLSAPLPSPLCPASPSPHDPELLLPRVGALRNVFKGNSSA